MDRPADIYDLQEESDAEGIFTAGVEGVRHAFFDPKRQRASSAYITARLPRSVVAKRYVVSKRITTAC